MSELGGAGLEHLVDVLDMPARYTPAQREEARGEIWQVLRNVDGHRVEFISALGAVEQIARGDRLQLIYSVSVVCLSFRMKVF